MFNSITIPELAARYEAVLTRIDAGKVSSLELTPALSLAAVMLETIRKAGSNADSEWLGQLDEVLTWLEGKTSGKE